MNEALVIKKSTALTEELLGVLLALEEKVFPSPLSREALRARLGDRKALVILVAWHGDTPCGYKVGFEESPEVFYSWVGGVAPQYRRLGIARKLLDEQHRVVKSMGFAYVRTSTKNKYREMLLLNIKAGFDVVGVQKKLKEAEQSIVLEKAL